MRERGRRNILTGQVVSDKMDKTISVRIYNLVKHPKYKKYVKSHSVFKAHDESNTAKTGDKVRIFQTRALSKTKRWKLLDLVSKESETIKKTDVLDSDVDTRVLEAVDESTKEKKVDTSELDKAEGEEKENK